MYIINQTLGVMNSKNSIVLSEKMVVRCTSCISCIAEIIIQYSGSLVNYGTVAILFGYTRVTAVEIGSPFSLRSTKGFNYDRYYPHDFIAKYYGGHEDPSYDMGPILALERRLNWNKTKDNSVKRIKKEKKSGRKNNRWVLDLQRYGVEF